MLRTVPLPRVAGEDVRGTIALDPEAHLTTGLAAAEAAPRPTHGPDSRSYIGAIDGLRAIAVVSVMVCHLERSWLPGGFTGVDVFFLVSGYVVTLSMADQRFASIRAMVAFFYARRLRRIAPALIVMLVVASVASVMFIPDAWLSEIIPSTGFSAFFGLSNITLASQTETYFAPRAEYNTFLHTWSLGVEEQFYLLFPALIALVTVERLRCWRGLALGALAILSLASLALCAWLTPREPVFSFFMLPARFWELGLGMILALTLPRWRPALARLPASAHDGLGLVGLAGLALSFALADAAAFPYPWALAPVLATALLVALVTAAQEGRAARALSLAPIASVGRISYSLYLWHWPVYVLARWTSGLESAAPRVAAIALTFGLAALSYRFVEQPFRRSARLKRLPRIAVVGLGLGALVAGAGVARAGFALSGVLSLSRTRDTQAWSPYSRPPAIGTCRARVATRWEAGVKIVDLTPEGCGELATARLLVAGDSHAGAYTRLLRSLAQAQRLKVSIYSSPGCGFMDLMTPVAEADAGCPQANDAMAGLLLARVRPGDVVFLPALRMHRYRSEEGGAIDESPTQAPPAAFAEAKAFVAALVAKRVRVILEAPKPVFKSPPFRCVDWFDRGNPICAAGFSEDRAEFERRRAQVLDAERALAAMPGVTIWDPAAVLCGPQRCEAMRAGVPLDFDTDHLSGFADDLLLPSFSAALEAVRR